MAFQYVKGTYRRAGRALSGSGVIENGMDNIFDLKGVDLDQTLGIRLMRH